MGSKLYVGNIPFNATEEDLRRVFSEGGRRVTDVQIMQDRFTGRSRGFAFVTMGSDQEATDAAAALNGANMGGRPMRVNEAQDRPGFQRGPGGGGGEGGGGGFRRGGGGGGGGRRDEHRGDYRS
jgi:RNA recognition motif-containing protein